MKLVKIKLPNPYKFRLNQNRKILLFKLTIILSILFSVKSSFSQKLVLDTMNYNQGLKFKGKSLIMPTILIGYGLIGIESDALKIFNTDIRGSRAYR